MRILTQDGSTVRPASLFDLFAKQAECSLGHPMAFVIAFFHYIDTWQLVINTATTIVTFLMVFLIQNSQNRDSAAIQLKLNELIRTREGAHNMLLNLEELSLSDIQELKAHYEKLASCA